MVFIRTENKVGARSAQVLARPARTENSSVRIGACVWMTAIFEEPVILILK
jgi:hypothetical protein